MPCIAAERVSRSRTTSCCTRGSSALSTRSSASMSWYDGDLGQRRRLDLRRRDRGDPPGEHVAVEESFSASCSGHVLVLLVLEQPPHQLGARVALLLRGLARPRPGVSGAGQEQPALDVGQRGRHHQELAGDVRFSAAISASDSRYFSVMSAMGMSKMSSWCSRIRWSSRSSGPSKFGSATWNAGWSAAAPACAGSSGSAGVWERVRTVARPYQSASAEGQTLDPHHLAYPFDHRRGDRPGPLRPGAKDRVHRAGVLLERLVPGARLTEGRVVGREQRLLVVAVALAPLPPRLVDGRRSRSRGAITLSSW